MEGIQWRLKRNKFKKQQRTILEVIEKGKGGGSGAGGERKRTGEKRYITERPSQSGSQQESKWMRDYDVDATLLLCLLPSLCSLSFSMAKGRFDGN